MATDTSTLDGIRRLSKPKRTRPTALDRAALNRSKQRQPDTYTNPNTGGSTLGAYDYDMAGLGGALAGEGDFRREQRQNDEMAAWLASQMNGGGGASGGSGGGGAPAFNVNGQIDFLTQLLQSGRLAPAQRTFTPDDALRRRLAQAVQGDRASADGAYDGLDQFLGQQAGQNAFDSLPEFAAGRRGTDTSALVRSQGGDARTVAALQDALGAEAQQGADAFNQLINVLGANERSSMQSRQAESAMARAYAQRFIDSQQLAGNTTIDLRDADRRRQVEEANFQSTEAGRQAELALAQQIAELAAQFSQDVPALAELLG